MKIVLLIFIGLKLLFILTIIIGRIINVQKYKIRSITGVQKAEYIAICGIEQYVQIRGQDISNPIIIVLHGGPGGNMAYYSYYWQAELEKDYTIVHWDQRGCGNTYYHNKEAEKPTLDLLLSDLDELVEYICLKYDKEKVIIMGHSWGTFLSGIYSGKRPERVSAYISISQMLDFKKSEQVSAREAMRLANEAGKAQNEQKIREKLKLIMTYQKLDKPEATELIKFRQLKERYLPFQHSNKIFSLSLFSPYMTWGELKWMFSFDKLIKSNNALYEALLSDGKLSMYDYNLHYEVAVIIISGERDWTTPHSMVFRYFNDITAPNKEFIAIENTGHIPFVDKSKDFSQALLKALQRV